MYNECNGTGILCMNVKQHTNSTIILSIPYFLCVYACLNWGKYERFIHGNLNKVLSTSSNRRLICNPINRKLALLKGSL